VAEEHTFWKRIWYLTLVGVMGAGYFIYAIAMGIWEWITKRDKS